MRIVGILLGLASVGVMASIVGCSEGPDDESGVAEGAATPDTKGTDPKTMFDQVRVCDGHVRFKAGVRVADLEAGVVRWKCGDVSDVDLTDGSNDFGQEYCEYHALVDGKNADATDRPAGDVKCVYTSNWADGDNAVDIRGFQNAVKTNIKASNLPGPENVKMQIGFNSRNAAKVLIDDCNRLAERTPMTNAERQTACFTAFKNERDPQKKGKLRAACINTDLSDNAKWKVAQDLGAKEISSLDPAEQEIEKDIAFCAHSFDVVQAKRGAVVLWRNSDPSICGRVLRAKVECGDDFGDLNSAKDLLHGFSLSSWADKVDLDPAKRNSGAGPVKPDPRCEFVPLGANGDHVMVCTPDAADVTKAKTEKTPMQLLCNKVFGESIAMAAPVGALAKKGSKPETPFCKAFHSGAAAMQSQLAAAIKAGGQ
jgi:hypothetical protein